MNDAFIIGVGATPVAEHWGLGLSDLAADAVERALADAEFETVDALFVGNMLGGVVNGQENVATLVADAADLGPIEAFKIEAACASGAAAVRAAYLAVRSGEVDIALAVGVEKMTDATPGKATAGLATAADLDFEASHGLSFVGLSALLMQRYLREHGVEREAFAEFAINAHRNGALNDLAMFRQPIDAPRYLASPPVAGPIGVLDAAPVCDGAAAVLVVSRRAFLDHHAAVRIAGSASATDTIALARRGDLLRLRAAELSARRAFDRAKLAPEAVDIFEAHDAFTIITALSLEACGFAARGEGWTLAKPDIIGIEGRLPLSTFGGLKARGHPVGASGAYQIVEAVTQLRGRAGALQVEGARRALTQSIGGHGSVAVTHVLES